MSFCTRASFKINFRHTCVLSLTLSIIPISWDLNHSVHYVFRLVGMVGSHLTFGVACVIREIPFILDYGIVPPEFCLYLLLQANQNYRQSGTHFL